MFENWLVDKLDSLIVNNEFCKCWCVIEGVNIFDR